MTKLLLLSIFISIGLSAQAVLVSGRVMDTNGQPLPFASILVKNTTIGVTANGNGNFQLELPAGDYHLMAQYIGYEKQEQTIHIATKPIQVDFILSLLNVSMKEVVVTPGAEDPAYEIIRKAIENRTLYLSPLKAFTCETYIKSILKTRKLPGRIMGKKIEASDKSAMGVDSAGKGILFLSESLTKVAFQKPNQLKLEVISGRQSGSSGFGFNFPTFINFYENNVKIFSDRLNPRGFVSPIAAGALLYYKYRYLGSYWEEGREINQIKVIPRRKYEPLFSGTIYITEGDWRIAGIDLVVTKLSQLELFDSIRIRQTQVPIQHNIWRVREQSLNFSFKQLGVDAEGFLVNTYSKYNTDPIFKPGYFDKVIMKYDTGANKKTAAFWDSVRTQQLEPEELQNFQQRDSLFSNRQRNAPPWNRDSLLKKQGAIQLKQILWDGFRRSDFDTAKPLRYGWNGILKQLEYNTVEGWVMQASGFVERKIHKKIQLRLEPHLRYGVSSRRLYGWGDILLSQPSLRNSGEPQKAKDQWRFSGGHHIQQLNAQSAVLPLMNSFQTLFFKNNYIKLYDQTYTAVKYLHRTYAGLKIEADLQWEHRSPLENQTDFTFSNRSQSFTPNYPLSQMNENFPAHEALTGEVNVEFRPGQRYIEYPSARIPIGSKYPTMRLSMKVGIPHILGSDVRYARWKFLVRDDVPLKLWGRLSYRVQMGGFLQTKHLFLQDYEHVNENQLLMASTYVNSFQLAPYYALSSDAHFISSFHAEHHFNGLLTNKIPLFRKLNWNLVASCNRFDAQNGKHYSEGGIGLENIFKVMRIDAWWGKMNGQQAVTGIRIGFDGLLGSNVKFRE